jgi:OFA family oxalate/formate antiporter-like MFS transporter
MMKTVKFYILWIVFLGSCVAGLMLIGHASAIGQELASITASQGAMLVGILAVANFGGRLIMGALSDHIGRYPTLMICLAGSTLDMVLMSQSRSFMTFLLAIILVGVTFGGVLATYPSIISDTFGTRNMGINYGIVFTAYGIAAILGPMAATTFKGSMGSYQPAFLFAGICSAVALVLVFVLARGSRSKVKETAEVL